MRSALRTVLAAASGAIRLSPGPPAAHVSPLRLAADKYRRSAEAHGLAPELQEDAVERAEAMAEKMLSDARAEADRQLREAREQAAVITSTARSQADELIRLRDDMARQLERTVLRRSLPAADQAEPAAEKPGSEARRAGRKAPLTAREMQVARMIARGATTAQIAEALFLSKRTIALHLNNIFRKTNARSRAELVRLLAELQATREQASAAGTDEGSRPR